METILFIGSATSGSSMDAIEAANRLGYRTLLMTNRKTFIYNQNDFPFLNKVIHLNVMDENTIRKQIIESINIEYTLQAIISFIDPYTSLAARLSNEFCNSSISSDALQIIEDKSSTREVLKDHPATCEFEIINGKQLIHSSMKYPFVLKKPVSNGSKDVYLIESEEYFDIAFKKLATQNPVIIEEFVDGDQYVIELLVCKGFPMIAAIIKQEITMEYTFIVTGYEVVIKMDETIYRDLRKSVISILGEIGLDHGACHLEMRHSRKGWKLIEINPRISGGAMNRMIFEAFGINLVQETIKLYLGKEPDLLRIKCQPVYTSFITINSYGILLEIEGEKEAVSSSGVVDIHLRPVIGTMMMPPISMGQRYGYVMAIGDTSVEAKERAELAVRYIKFYVELI
ncbi:ATP-grasp domain-containing protein [Sporosarcina thermotolerans]|uniref:ATP-grasp domain-containing protein n=1 Tax=Sporosarcina thermotolerans TaxID=633404 RepID=A0AAW9A425_9BACL|nr:ATP-grasp domain-containing protein [Sporosarcina thermotolerans]MDW0115477.1 ATP-grasp domain-containing protein [Sporosarcina thermotolerans]WHT47196.1 ATP-grasp domain-containing protein [Sporosarcina thermotolerans]